MATGALYILNHTRVKPSDKHSENYQVFDGLWSNHHYAWECSLQGPLWSELKLYPTTYHCATLDKTLFELQSHFVEDGIKYYLLGYCENLA